MYPVRENAHIQMYLLLPLLNLIDVNVITYVCLFVCFQLFEEIPLQSGVQQNEDIATWFLLEVFKDNQCRQFWQHSK